jgi:hypothetical protein
MARVTPWQVLNEVRGLGVCRVRTNVVSCDSMCCNNSVLVAQTICAHSAQPKRFPKHILSYTQQVLRSKRTADHLYMST